LTLSLLESTYEQCLAHVLHRAGIAFKQQHPLPVEYKRTRLDCCYRVDVLVNDKLILDLKSVEEVKLRAYTKAGSLPI
jgi:GxxExxY protein